MRKFVLCIITIFVSSLFTGCEGQAKLPKELPKELPPNTEIIYISEGGMLPSFFKIVISGNTMKVTEQSVETGRKEVIREVKLSDDEVKTLYRIFVENKFDSIRPNKKIEVPDGKTRSIELKFDQQSFYAIKGDGIETTQTDGERFNNIEKAFSVLIKRRPTP
jgi:hypothetical protein